MPSKILTHAVSSSMTRRYDIDWELIERDYRLGALTIKMLVEKHGVDASAITRRAKKHGWTRDLSEQVRIETKALVNQAVLAHAQESAAKHMQSTSQSTSLNAMEVTSNAVVNARIIMRHQKGAEADTELMTVLRNRLQDQATQSAKMDELIELLKAQDPLAMKEFYKAISLSTHINELKQLTEVHANIIKTERQAFSIDAEEVKQPPALEAAIKSLDAKRLAEQANG